MMVHAFQICGLDDNQSLQETETANYRRMKINRSAQRQFSLSRNYILQMSKCADFVRSMDVLRVLPYVSDSYCDESTESTIAPPDAIPLICAELVAATYAGDDKGVCDRLKYLRLCVDTHRQSAYLPLAGERAFALVAGI
jgi:hypothetical protein